MTLFSVWGVGTVFIMVNLEYYTHRYQTLRDEGVQFWNTGDYNCWNQKRLQETAKPTR